MFSSLNRGEAVIYTPLAGDPAIAEVEPFILPEREPQRIDPKAERHACEVSVHPADLLPDLTTGGASATQEVMTQEVISVAQLDPSDL